jgi:hypothetical protein
MPLPLPVSWDRSGAYPSSLIDRRRWSPRVYQRTDGAAAAAVLGTEQLAASWADTVVANSVWAASSRSRPCTGRRRCAARVAISGGGAGIRVNTGGQSAVLENAKAVAGVRPSAGGSPLGQQALVTTCRSDQLSSTCATRPTGGASRSCSSGERSFRPWSAAAADPFWCAACLRSVRRLA